VVGYDLAALLSDGPAAGIPGVVRSVAVQQAAVHPMDDLVLELEDQVGLRVLGLQIKRPLRITAAASNTDFRKVLDAAVATRKMPSFQTGPYAYGFIAEHVAVKSFRSFSRLINWARVDVSGADFQRRFEDGGSAATVERQMRAELLPLIDAQTADDELAFYRDFIALRVDGLSEGGIQRAGTLMHLQSLIADEQGGTAELLFDRLCHLASEGAGRGQKWNRYPCYNSYVASCAYVGLPATPQILRGFNAFPQMAWPTFWTPLAVTISIDRHSMRTSPHVSPNIGW